MTVAKLNNWRSDKGSGINWIGWGKEAILITEAAKGQGAWAWLSQKNIAEYSLRGVLLARNIKNIMVAGDLPIVVKRKHDGRGFMASN